MEVAAPRELSVFREALDVEVVAVAELVGVTLGHQAPDLRDHRLDEVSRARVAIHARIAERGHVFQEPRLLLASELAGRGFELVRTADDLVVDVRDVLDVADVEAAMA